MEKKGVSMPVGSLGSTRFINWLLPSTQWLNLQTAVDEFQTLLTGQVPAVQWQCSQVAVLSNDGSVKW